MFKTTGMWYIYIFKKDKKSKRCKQSIILFPSIIFGPNRGLTTRKSIFSLGTDILECIGSKQ